MHAIANQVHENHPDYKIIYVTSEEFGNDLISSINDNNTALFHDKYRNAGVLLIDDIQFFSNKERMQEEFFHTFNKLHAEGKQIVITSDKPPKELKTLEDRIRSRFSGDSSPTSARRISRHASPSSAGRQSFWICTFRMMWQSLSQTVLRPTSVSWRVQ